MIRPAPLRPLTLAELFDAATWLYRTYVWRLLAISVLFHIALTIVFGSIIVGVDYRLLTHNAYGLDPWDQPLIMGVMLSPAMRTGIFSGWPGPRITQFVVGLMLGAVVAHAVLAAWLSSVLAARYLPRTAPLTARRRWASVAAVLVLGLGGFVFGEALGGFMLLMYDLLRTQVQYLLRDPGFVPRFVLQLVWMTGSAVAIPAAVIEGGGPVFALWRSVRLVRHGLGRTLAIMLMLLISAWLFGLGLILLVWLGFHVLGFTREQSLILLFRLAALIPVPLLPFQAALTTVLYVDLRCRAEGYDLKLRLEREAAAG